MKEIAKKSAKKKARPERHAFQKGSKAASPPPRTMTATFACARAAVFPKKAISLAGQGAKVHVAVVMAATQTALFDNC
ncbi:MAG: hypothetical protein ACRCV9_08640 [Burkholderiaceae bacterium]